MGPGSKDVEEVIPPDKPPKGSSEKQNKPPNPSANKRKEKKRKKPIYKPHKLLALFLWIAFIATFVVGGIGLVNLILSLYLRGGPNWNYVLIVTNLGRDVEMIVYGFEGHKRDTNIRMKRNVTFAGNLDIWGVNGRFRKKFKEAEKMIPWLSRSSSPVLFAGARDMRDLRKENKSKYDDVMMDLENLFKRSSLKVLPDSLRIVDDWEEALHGWVTLNYLSDNMIKGRQPIKSKRDIFTTRETFGLFDLGPTSLHFSYEVPRVLDNTELQPGVRVITLYGRVYYVYTQTFPCSGASRVFDKYFAYKYEEEGRTGPGGKKLKKYDVDKLEFSYAYCFNEDRNEGPLRKILNVTRGYPTTKGTQYSPSHISSVFPSAGPCTRFDFVLQPCSKRKEVVRNLNKKGLQGHKHFYFNGGHDSKVCKAEVEEMMDRCSKFFINEEACPVFEIPKRPYNVTFIMSNELAVYAELAGIKNGDPKEVWGQKRNAICNIDGLKGVIDKYPSKTADMSHHKHLCLMITYLEYILNKFNLNETEWSHLRFQRDIGSNRIAWQLGYVANITNTLPTNSPFHDVFTLEDIFIQGLVYSGILTVSSVFLSFALRNSNTLASRPLKIPQ